MTLRSNLGGESRHRYNVLALMAALAQPLHVQLFRVVSVMRFSLRLSAPLTRLPHQSPGQQRVTHGPMRSLAFRVTIPPPLQRSPVSALRSARVALENAVLQFVRRHRYERAAGWARSLFSRLHTNASRRESRHFGSNLLGSLPEPVLAPDGGAR